MYRNNLKIVVGLLVAMGLYLWPSLVIQTDEFRPIMVGWGYFGGWGGVSMAYLLYFRRFS